MPRPGGPGPGGRIPEKSKDFFGSIKRLLSNLKTWRVIIFTSLILAMISAILSLIAPDKLSDLTDTVTAGIKPNTDKLAEISETIENSLSEEKMNRKLANIMGSNIPEEDLQKFYEIMNEMSLVEEEEKQQLFFTIPESVLSYLLEDIVIDNVTISVQDQIQMIQLVAEMGEETGTEKALALMDQFPESIYTLVKPSIDMNKIKKIAFILLILYGISAIFNYIQGYSMTTVSNSFAKNLRSRISTKINCLPLKYFDRHEQGDVLSRVTNDVDTIAQNLNQSLATLVSSITLFVGSIIMMFVTNWIMAITAIIASLFGFCFMFLLLGKSQKYFVQKQTELGELNGYIEEIYAGHNVVQVYNGTKESIQEFDKLNSKLYESNRKSQFLSGLMQPIMGFVGNFSYVAVCVVGALLAMNGHITFGVIVAFMIYIRLFTNPLSQIAQAMTSLQSTAAASERVFEFLDEEEMTNQDTLSKKLDKSKVKGEIEFKKVKFSYDEGRPIIKDFSVKAKPGQKIAIVGPTGAGKTTMVNLLMKFYEINDGDILIDGVSTKELTRENIHDLFIMVLQDTWLFNGTIGENIRFNQKDVTDEQVWKALHTVGVDHFVKTLPGGLNATIGDNDSISQGQKQLLTIARGMIEDAPFLILDEATSNVDTRTEELVQKAMDKLTEGRTSFIIAHRLSTIKNADLILVMRDGNIVEQGSHEGLLMKKGFYADLYNSQFESFSE